MRITHDADVDAAYLYLKEEINNGEAWEQYYELIDAEDLEADVILDLDVHGHLLGIEIIGASVLLSAPTIDLADEISDSFGGQAVRHQFPVYLDASTDLLRALLGQIGWVAAERVLRLPLPTEAAGWVDLHLDGEEHLLRVEIGHATSFVHPDALADAIGWSGPAASDR